MTSWLAVEADSASPDGRLACLSAIEHLIRNQEGVFPPNTTVCTSSCRCVHFRRYSPDDLFGGDVKMSILGKNAAHRRRMSCFAQRTRVVDCMPARVCYVSAGERKQYGSNRLKMIGHREGHTSRKRFWNPPPHSVLPSLRHCRHHMRTFRQEILQSPVFFFPRQLLLGCYHHRLAQTRISWQTWTLLFYKPGSWAPCTPSSMSPPRPRRPRMQRRLLFKPRHLPQVILVPLPLPLPLLLVLLLQPSPVPRRR